MQTSSMITFHCPSCGMKLQVPGQMAGVAGPCPECSATITAPTAAPQTADAIPAAPVPQAPQPVQQHTEQRQQGIPQQNIVGRESQPAPVSLRQPSENQTSGHPQQHPGMGAPRSEMPQSTQQTPASNPTPAQAAGQPSNRESLPRHIEPPKAQRNWMRVIFPLAFLGVAAVTVLVVLQAVGIYEIYDFSKFTSGNTDKTELDVAPDSTPTPVNPENNSNLATPAPSVEPPASAVGTPDDSQPASTGQDPKTSPVPGEFPELQLPPPSTESNGDAATPTSTEPAEPPGETNNPSAEVTPPTPEEKSPPTAGSRAYQILTKFLEATTLEERLPLMSASQRTPEELKTTCLAKRLGQVKSKRLAEMVPRASDGMIQYLYYVSFEDKTEPQMRHRIVVQLVERPEVHPPRVHADAFIEHYEKKFSTYGKQPIKGVTTFHCIAEVRTSDLAKNIPEELKKETVRLMIKTHPHGKAMFDAFLNKNSPLMDRIGPGKDFPYVESRFCILSFRWNTENPEKPYVELNDIVTAGWEK